MVKAKNREHFSKESRRGNMNKQLEKVFSSRQEDLDSGQEGADTRAERAYDPLQNQLCRVCEEPAAGFHFGAFTCEGCKSFFGRTCNNHSVIQECKNNYRCVVDKKNRTACKACRLRKCLVVGMSKSGSRYGRRSNWFKIHCLMQQTQQVKSKTCCSSTSTSSRSSGKTPRKASSHVKPEEESFHLQSPRDESRSKSVPASQMQSSNYPLPPQGTAELPPPAFSLISSNPLSLFSPAMLAQSHIWSSLLLSQKASSTLLPVLDFGQNNNLPKMCDIDSKPIDLTLAKSSCSGEIDVVVDAGDEDDGRASSDQGARHARDHGEMILNLSKK